MFSFFKSSKKSPVPSPTEPPKSEDTVQRGGDDFVLVGGNPLQPQPLYPAMPPAAPAHPHIPFNRQYSLQIANYTQNVPFKLHPVLCSNEGGQDLFEYKLREISNLFAEEFSCDYDFKLERSILDRD